MKILILISLLALSLLPASSCQAQDRLLTQDSSGVLITSSETQEVIDTPAENAPKAGFFARIWDKLNDEALYGVLGLIGGIFAKKGWITTFKKWLGYGVKITLSISHLLDKTSNGLSILNNAIQDNGKLKENSLKEIMKAKKEITLELNDALVTIKPKKSV